jgi:hypothetical protein
MLDDARAAADTLASNLRSGASNLQTELDSIRGELSSVREGRLEAESSAARSSSRPSGTSSTAAAMAAEPASVDPDEIDDTAVEDEPEVILEVEETVVEVGANGDGAATLDDDEMMAEDEGAEAAEEASAPQSSGSGRSIRGAEGARLIALNMALNGTPRDETARYLSQNFDLDDQDALLDEVYARVGD